MAYETLDVSDLLLRRSAFGILVLAHSINGYLGASLFEEFCSIVLRGRW